MSKKTKLTVIIIILFLFIGAFIVYIFNELLQENDIEKEPITINEAITFKSKYEDLNDDETIEYVKVEIPEINPMKAITIEELVEKINKEESFLVYFGNPTSQWCRTMVVQMIETAKEMEIPVIYYLSINDIKDVYELDSKNKVVKAIDGTGEYHLLLDNLNSLLDNYPNLKYKNKKKKIVEVKVNSKYIKEPSVVYFKDGKGYSTCDGISNKQENPYDITEKEITDETKQEFVDIFNDYLNNKKD